MRAVRSFFFCAICAFLYVGYGSKAFCTTHVKGIDSHSSAYNNEGTDGSTTASVDAAEHIYDDSADEEEDVDENDSAVDKSPAPEEDKKPENTEKTAVTPEKKHVLGTRSMWPYREVLWHKEVDVDDDDGENTHIPYSYNIEDLYKNAFYCAIANDVVGLHALLGELRTIGEELDFLLEGLRTKEGDNLLLRAAKNDAVDTVRYLLSIGSEVDVIDRYGNTPLDVAISLGNIAMVNSIAEMKIKFRFKPDNDE